MKVMTVTGPVDIDDLGIISPHEHILSAFDGPGLWPDASHRPDLVWGSMTMENLGVVRRNYCAIREDCILHDIGDACYEMELYKRAGGGTVMDASCYGIHGLPAGLKEVSERTGVYIIAGTGFYVDKALTEEEKSLGLEGMYDVMMRDLTVGFPGTGVKAGFIGEVATSNTMTWAEENCMRAAARAQRDTGVSMNVHVCAVPHLCRKILHIFKEEGVDLSKVVFAHFDGSTVEFFREMAGHGITCEVDSFGVEFYADNGSFDSDTPWYTSGTDETWVRLIKDFVDAGLDGSLVLSQDVCTRMQQARYGGYGYAHVLENIVPMLEHIGIKKSVIDEIIRENPKKVLRGGKGAVI
jgi:phosphotriesterase-related protein